MTPLGARPHSPTSRTMAAPVYVYILWWSIIFLSMCTFSVYACVYVSVQWSHQLFSPLLLGCTSIEAVCGEKGTFTYSSSLMLEVMSFDTLIVDAESGVDKYLVFKDTMSGYSLRLCVCVYVVCVCACACTLTGVRACMHILSLSEYTM